MKKLAGIFLTVLMLFTMLAVFAVPAMAESPYAELSGSGTEISPYLIGSRNDWDAFISSVESDPTHGDGMYFKLTNDIGSEGNEVCNSVLCDFSGIFYGADKTIWYNGEMSLFNCNYGEIKNIVIRSGSEKIFILLDGGIVCIQNFGVIDHCVNYASLNSGIWGGGICGTNEGLIINCINYAPVESSMGEGTGGICGDNAGQIINCINTGTVSKGGICATCNDIQPACIDICFNCSLPLPQYGIAELPGMPKAVAPDYRCLNHCSYYVPDGNHGYKASNNDFNNDYIGQFGGSVAKISYGVKNMNWAIDEYDNQTGRKLCKWEIGKDGLPIFAEAPTGSIISEGNICFLIVVAVVVLGGIATLVIVKIKRKTA